MRKSILAFCVVTIQLLAGCSRPTPSPVALPPSTIVGTWQGTESLPYASASVPVKATYNTNGTLTMIVGGSLYRGNYTVKDNLLTQNLPSLHQIPRAASQVFPMQVTMPLKFAGKDKVTLRQILPGGDRVTNLQRAISPGVP